MKRALGACALILALAVSFMSPASAAKLVLTGGQRPSFATSARCDDAVAVTTPSTAGTSRSVQVSGIAAACTGALAVRVYDASGVSKATGSATVAASGGVQTLTVSPAYAPSTTDRVSVTLGTWPIAATWTYTPAPTYPVCAVYRVVDGVETLQSGKSCTVSGLSVAGKAWGQVGSRRSNVDVAFTFTGATHPDYFKFTIDMGTAGLPADWSWSNAGTAGGNLLLSSAYRCSSLPILTGSSNPSWGPTNGFQFQVDEDRSASDITCAR